MTDVAVDAQQPVDKTSASRKQGQLIITGKEAVITTLVVIMLTPLSVLAGYLITSRLESSKIDIRYVTAYPEFQSLTLPAPLATDMMVYTDVVKNLVIYSITDINGGASSYDPNAQFSRILMMASSQSTIDYDIAKSFLPLFPRVVQVLNNEEARIRYNLSVVQGWKEGPLPILAGLDVGSESGFSSVSELRQKVPSNPQAVVEELEARSRFVQSSVAFCNALSGFLTEAIQSNKPPRTGGMAFEVGIINEGDTDGILAPDAVLSFADAELPLRPQQTSVFQVIEAHSFKSVRLVIDQRTASPASLTRWRSLVVNYGQEAFTIVINPKEKDEKAQFTSVLPP